MVQYSIVQLMYIVHDRDYIALTMYNPTNAIICLKHKVKLII